MRKLITATILILLHSFSGFAQRVQVAGIVYENVNENEVPLPFANIIEAGTSNGASSDFDGKFVVSLDAGERTLLISSVGYVSQRILVQVDPTDTKPIKVVMKTNAEIMQEVAITAKRNLESEAMLLIERKEGNGIVQQIGAEQLAKTGSNTVAAGLSKIAGISMVGQNNVFVRGLGDRYNSAYLNGLPIASPDPDKRVAPLSIFSSSIVKNISVDKAYVPSLYGDFSGGAIDIRTKDYFEKPTFNIGLSSGFNSSVPGSNFQTYRGGRKDIWGVDDGTRAIPSGIASGSKYNSSEGLESNQKFDYNLNPQSRKTPLNTGFSLYGGNYKKVGKNQNGAIGYLLLASHNNNASVEEGNYKLVNKQDELQLDYKIRRSNLDTRSAVLGNLYLEPNDKHSIQYNFLGVNISKDQVQETDGQHFDYAKNIYSRRFTFRKNQLLVHQLHGKHNLPIKGLSAKWDASYSSAQSDEPDRRQFVYLYDDGASKDAYVFNAIDRLDNHRFFSELLENEVATNASLQYDILSDKNVADATLLSVETGFQYRVKNRSFDYRQFIYDLSGIDELYPDGVEFTNPEAYLNDENHELGAFNVSEVVNPASAYNVSLQTQGTYINLNYGAMRKFGVMLGLRYENADQFILYRDQTQPLFERKNILNSASLLPAMGLKYATSDIAAVRLNMSKTISRPGFKEVAPFEWTEVFSGVKMVGNPNLQNGTNYNLDLRYEIYPNHGELLSVTTFYKHLDNPIERSNLATASGRLQSFQNADKATVAGVELEATKKINITGNDSSFINKFSIGANFAYIYSRVTLGEDLTGTSTINTNNIRPLQGASPYLANVNLNWEDYLSNDRKASVSLSYNIFGRRLFAAGIQGIGDMYELPAGSLNLIASLDVSKRLKLGVSGLNLLNPRFNTIQETDAADINVNSYRSGFRVGFTLQYSVF